MNAFYRAVALTAALLLAGCSHSTDTQETRPQAWLQPGTLVTLPPPGISPAVSSQQLLTGSFNGQTQSLLVMLNADAHKVTLAGLSSVGIRLFLATYDETGIHTEQSIVVPQLPKGWTLTDTGDRRELRNASGKLVTEIVYLQRKGKREPISIEQHVFKYHITIQYLGD